MDRSGKAVREVIFFVSLYLLLSLPPYFILNPEIPAAIGTLALVATLGTGVIICISALLFAKEGVDRYVQFLLTPMDSVSIGVNSSFILAAVSWWLVPELARFFGWELQFGLLLAAIVTCHIPMVLFLSLMTSIGKAKGT